MSKNIIYNIWLIKILYFKLEKMKDPNKKNGESNLITNGSVHEKSLNDTDAIKDWANSTSSVLNCVLNEEDESCEEPQFQVNVHYDINDVPTPSIDHYHEDGYVWILTDTVYLDGRSYTDWCACVWTYEECEEYCAKVQE